MRIHIRHELHFIELEVTFRGEKLKLDNVLLDRISWNNFLCQRGRKDRCCTCST